MPKIGNGNEPLLERALFVYDGTLWRPLSANTSGQIVAALASGSTVIVTQSTAANLKALVDINTGQTIAVTQATAANLKALVDLNTDQNVQARAHGFDGSTWRKLQQLWGYTSAYGETVLNTSAAAGSNTLSSTAVAAGYVHVIRSAAYRDINNGITFGYHAATIGGTQRIIKQVGAVAANTFTSDATEIVLAAGDTYDAILGGCTLNDDIDLHLMGYKMKVND